MKKLFLLALASAVTINSFAATYTIMVADFSFTPATGLTVHPGDIIEWKWAGGTHTTTSTSIPLGATAWDSPITSSSTTFDYTVPAALGTYNYKCTPHASMGMTGSFTVVDATGVGNVTSPVAFNIFPNPVSSMLHLQFAETADAQVTVFDLTGRAVMNTNIRSAKDTDLNMQQMAPGSYIVCAEQNGKVYRKELTVIH